MIAALALLLLAQENQVGGASFSGPTPEETLALELVNRMRADPAGEAARLLQLDPRPTFEGFDAEMFTAEMRALQPAPPLVFHPALVVAGRSHCRYTALHRAFGHREEPGREGFTGEFGGDRALHAGYPANHGRAVENAGSFLLGGVSGVHWAYVLDDGPGGPGGMQPGRGHRKAMISERWREYGTGFREHADGRLESSALFGPGRGHRLVGGVAYIDLDGDGAYSVGEGVGSLPVALKGGASAATWPSGAYALDAGPATGSAPIDWSLRFHGLTLTERAEAGDDNVKFDGELLGAVQRQLTLHLPSLGKKGRRGRLAAQEVAYWLVALPEGALEVDLPDEVAQLATAWRDLREKALRAADEGSWSLDGARRDLARDSQARAFLDGARALSVGVDELGYVTESSKPMSWRLLRARRLIERLQRPDEQFAAPSLIQRRAEQLARARALVASLEAGRQ